MFIVNKIIIHTLRGLNSNYLLPHLMSYFMTKIEEIRLKELGKRLKYFRKKAGYTNYNELASEIGISRSRYGSYENGGNIKFSTLVKILSHFKITLGDFFKEGFDD